MNETANNNLKIERRSELKPASQKAAADSHQQRQPEA